jgi:hypothetical protein
MGILLIVMGIGLVVFVGVFIWAAVLRMTGRRSRFDSLAETFVRAQGAGVYPPSLRADPEPKIVEQIEDGRGARASRDTPSEQR